MPVEKLSPSDLETLVTIEQASYPDPWSRDMLACAWTEPNYKGVKYVSGGEICGYLITLTLPPEMEILNIAVSPKFRRHGIAREMMDWVLDDGKRQGCSKAFLEVRISNAAAIKLYESFGFSVMSTRKNYYRDGEDCFVMGTNLM